MTAHHRLVRRFALVAVLGLAALGAVACGSSKHTAAPTATTAAPSAGGGANPQWQAVLDAANKEGQVEVYNVASPAQVTAVQKAWAAAYPGIKLSYDRLSPAEVEARAVAELGAGVHADVIYVA